MRLLKASFVIMVLLASAMSAQASRDPNAVAGGLCAHAAGMGDASVAFPGTNESVFFNPAALVQVHWPELTSGLANQDLGDQRVYYFSGSIPVIEGLVAGIGLSSVVFPDNLDHANQQYRAALAFPLSKNGQLMFGLTGKYVKRWIGKLGDSADGGGIDLGLLYQAILDEDGQLLQFGMSLVDAQTTLTINQEDILMPVLFRVGGFYRNSWGSAFGLTFENLNSPNDHFENERMIRLGIEQQFNIRNSFVLKGRMGFLHDLQEPGLLAAGLGIEYDNWRVDYALQMPTTLQDALHLMSVSWGFDKQNRKNAVEKERRLAADKVKEPLEIKKDELFDALESAAELGGEFSIVESKKKQSEPSRVTKEKVAATQEQAAEEKNEYRMPVPEGPAGMDQASLGIAPEMPAAFSGQFGNRRAGGFDIQEQDLRLHVVVNPFSPNDDGRQDKTIFVGRLVDERLDVSKWVLTISRGGEVVRFFKGGSRLPRNLEWDGRDTRGKKLTDGNYSAILRIMDQHNMELASASQPVVIRTRPRTFAFESPGDRIFAGDKNDKPIAFSFPKIPGSSDWTFIIRDAVGKSVFRKNGNGALPENITWNPMGKGPVDAGIYTAIMTFIDDVGLKSSEATTFKIRYADFGAALEAAPLLFKPRGNQGEGVRFALGIKGEMKIKTWILEIFEKDKREAVKTFRGQGFPKSMISWDGMLGNGKPAQGGGAYFARLTVYSSVGTKAFAESQEMQCDVGAYSGEKALSINLVRVQFEKRSAELDEKSQKALLASAETLKKYPTEYLLRVQGYCSKQEMAGDEVGLSRKRAETVASYLINQAGIPAEKIEVVGRGDADPLDKGEGAEAEKRNRRVEIILYAK